MTSVQIISNLTTNTHFFGCFFLDTGTRIVNAFIFQWKNATFPLIATIDSFSSCSLVETMQWKDSSNVLKINSQSVNTTINPSNNTWFQIVFYFCNVQKRLVHNEAKITLFCAVALKSLRKEGQMPLCTVVYKKVADVGGHGIKAFYDSWQCFVLISACSFHNCSVNRCHSKEWKLRVCRGRPRSPTTWLERWGHWKEWNVQHIQWWEEDLHRGAATGCYQVQDFYIVSPQQTRCVFLICNTSKRCKGWTQFS